MHARSWSRALVPALAAAAPLRAEEALPPRALHGSALAAGVRARRDAR